RGSARRCQDWDVPEFAASFGAKAHHYVCLRDILRNTRRCLACDAIAAATQAPASGRYWLRYSKNEPRRLNVVEDWEVDFFDAQILKGWVDGYNLPSGFRVIDIVDVNVVQPSTPVRFVAPSYMWESSADAGRAQLEKANAQDLGSPGGLASVTLPPIISDTISLCRDLGERYLWADPLCIAQDDEYSKPNQIDGMDRIYRSASSIMAALDDRQGHGFPGYAGNPRRPRASLWGPARSRNVGRGIDPNGMQTVVDASLWNRRGWTFQERLQPKRRLFIAEYQVLFECCRGQAAEELPWGRRPSRAGDAVDGADEALESLEENTEGGGPGTDSEAARETANDPVAAAGKEGKSRMNGFLGSRASIAALSTTETPPSSCGTTSRWLNYCAWAEDYTSRWLSRSGDMLNAFAGAGNAVKKAMRTETLFGLPEVYLPQALMWSHTGPAARKGARGRGRAAVDFIVISASLDGGLGERNEWAFVGGQFHEMWRFNVMLVERLPCEPFAARRLGVGYV
ncbi:hypothetical protein CSHISOI_07724, partial [Colletotrichum shisoi]